MKTKELLQGYFDDRLSADETKKYLGTGRHASLVLRMIEMDELGRDLLSSFAAESGAAERLASFMAEQDPTPITETSGRRLRPPAFRPEVVGFERQTRSRKRKKKVRAARGRKKR
ncbi:MAG TPA: hypothetical protein VGF06_17785 [Terriglobales bacterium]|jgi:hypothetical protein